MKYTRRSFLQRISIAATIAYASTMGMYRRDKVPEELPAATAKVDPLYEFMAQSKEIRREIITYGWCQGKQEQLERLAMDIMGDGSAIEEHPTFHGHPLVYRDSLDSKPLDPVTAIDNVLPMRDERASG